MDLLGQEIFRLLRLSKEHNGDELLKEALAGREKSADTVARLVNFLVRNFGQEGSAVVDKYWKVCGAFLEEAGVDEKQLAKIRRPFPVPGDKDFKSVLEEFEQ